ncbi:unnamed protein product [Leptosia nina]|uniref:FLYWCH-type domain-containing protein n=1 Tax=Leptosia nina TaxID=320188 RepID=A0AAV1J5F4_9NEOP
MKLLSGFQFVSVNSETVPEVLNIVYRTTLDGVPEIISVLSHPNDTIPDFVNVTHTTDDITGTYVQTSANIHDSFNVITDTCPEADLLNLPHDAAEILNMVNNTHQNPDIFNLVRAPQEVSDDYYGPLQHASDTFNAISTPQNASEIFDVVTAPHDTEMLSAITNTSQAIPDAYNGLSTMPAVQELYEPPVSVNEIATQSVTLDSKETVSDIQTTNATPELSQITSDTNNIATRTITTTIYEPVTVTSGLSVTPKKPSPSKKSTEACTGLSTKSTRTCVTSAVAAATQGGNEFVDDPYFVKSQIIELHNGKKLLIVNGYPFYFRHKLKTSPLSRWCCNRNSCNAPVFHTGTWKARKASILLQGIHVLQTEGAEETWCDQVAMHETQQGEVHRVFTSGRSAESCVRSNYLPYT